MKKQTKLKKMNDINDISDEEIKRLMMKEQIRKSKYVKNIREQMKKEVLEEIDKCLVFSDYKPDLFVIDRDELKQKLKELK